MNKLSAALPIAHVVLRILIVLNWLGGAAILALLVVMPNEQWIMAAFKLSPSPDTDRLIMGLRAIAALGLAGIPLNYAVLKRLLAIVETVRTGDPFVAANASRLQALAWALLALVGDAADGYPGIPGIGARTAAQLLNRYGQIENFPPSVLGERRDLALLFKNLATLRTDAPLFKKVETLRWRGATPAFAAWAERMKAPRLLERCEKAAIEKGQS